MSTEEVSIKKYLPEDITEDIIKRRIINGAAISKVAHITKDSDIIDHMLYLVNDGIKTRKLDETHVIFSIGKILPKPTDDRPLSILREHLHDIYSELEAVCYAINKPKPIKVKDITEIDQEIVMEAKNILNGDPISYLQGVFAESHIGDTIPYKCMMLSAASQSVLNSKGLHVMFSGESGKGKTKNVEDFTKQIPEEHVVSSGFSNKALLVHPIPEKSILYLDDRELPDDMQGLLKLIMNDNRKPAEWKTVGSNMAGICLHTPQRPIIFMSTVKGIGDDQLFNRALKPYVDDSKETDMKVSNLIFKTSEKLPSEFEKCNHKLEVAKTIWKILYDTNIWVRIPNMSDWETCVSDRRYPEMVIEMIKSFAKMRYTQRNTIHDIDKDGNEVTVIDATEDDINEAQELMKAITGNGGAQQTHLLDTEFKIVKFIIDNSIKSFTIQSLSKQLTSSNINGKSSKTIEYAFNGRPDRNYEGILSKCPHIYTDDVSENESVRDGDMNTISRGKRSKSYNVDIEALKMWITRIGLYKKSENKIIKPSINKNDVTESIPKKIENLETIDVFMEPKVNTRTN